MGKKGNVGGHRMREKVREGKGNEGKDGRRSIFCLFLLHDDDDDEM